MRIAIISNTFRLIGGTERYLDAVSVELARRGHDVAQIGEGFHRPGAFPQFEVHRFDYVAQTHRAFRAIREAVALFRPDVVHVHNVNNPFLTSLLLRAFPGLLRTLHGFYTTCPITSRWRPSVRRNCLDECGAICYGRSCLRWMSARDAYMWIAKRWVEPFNIRRHSLIWVASNAVADIMRRCGGAGTNLEVLPYFHEPWTVPGQPVSSPPSILFVGRFCVAKGVFDFLEVLARLPENVTGVMVGDGPERENVERRMRELGLGDRVRFPGWLLGKELAQAYDRAHLTVFPSLWMEPFGLIGLEAMSRKRPIVGYDVGGVRDWLVEGRTGMLVEEGDVSSLSRACQTLIEEPSLARRLGESGHEFFRRRFGKANHLERLIEAYEERRVFRRESGFNSSS